MIAPESSDRDLTLRLAAAMGVVTAPDAIDPLFACRPRLTEWSLNAATDQRGAFRISVWTTDRAAAGAVVDRLAPAQRASRDALVGDDFEGLGLAFRGSGAPSFRWWALAGDGVAMAARATAAWPEHAVACERLLSAAGGAHTCSAVGLEASGSHQRSTIYAQVRTPEIAVRLLELAAVPVSRGANLFFKGILGLEAGGRGWPKVWVGRSFGTGGGWKFYYFARGDDERRTDEVLLDAAGASPAVLAAWQVLHADVAGPVVQLVGITFPDAGAPSFTTYLART